MFTYPKETNLNHRFKHLLLFCIRQECVLHEKNQLEKIGDYGLFLIERVQKQYAALAILNQLLFSSG